MDMIEFQKVIQALQPLVGELTDGAIWVAAMYIGTAVQGWCLEYNAAGLLVALTNTTADAMRSTKGLDITFK